MLNLRQSGLLNNGQQRAAFQKQLPDQRRTNSACRVATLQGPAVPPGLPQPSFKTGPRWLDVAEEAPVQEVLPWTRPTHVPRVTAGAAAPPIILLPGFGNDSSDYRAPFGCREHAMAAHLEARGFAVYVVPIERTDWLRVARGMLTFDFWRGRCTTDEGYQWYLERVSSTVDLAVAETGCSHVDLIGHSAGGWLARAFLGDARYFGQTSAVTDTCDSRAGRNVGRNAAAAADSTHKVLNGQQHSHRSYKQRSTANTGCSSAVSQLPNPRVRSLVTLGTPQRPATLGMGYDVTGGALRWVDTAYPGAFFSGHGVRYVTVSGRTVMGCQGAARKDQKNGHSLPGTYAFHAYHQVCGEGEGIMGDCVVPLHSSQLEGATSVVLDGVFHGFTHGMSKVSNVSDPSGVIWYGSDEVVDLWLHHLLDEEETPLVQAVERPAERM